MTPNPGDAQTPEDLKERFCFRGLTFERGSGGLVRAVVSTDSVTGELYLHGAHVTAFRPHGHESVLWMSAASVFEPGKPIRGGVPICFPWFGPHPSDNTLPGHGRARLQEWTLASVWNFDDGGIGLQLQTVIDNFELSYHVHFGRRLELELRVSLPSDAASPAIFEEALHTYLAVSDIRQVRVAGLESSEFIDKVGNAASMPATGEPIEFPGETDRVYAPTSSPCVLTDPEKCRTITVAKAGSQSTVVWNPWIAKSARMPDFGDHEWPGMVCIETANVGASAVTLHAGQSHTMAAVISVSHN